MCGVASLQVPEPRREKNSFFGFLVMRLDLGWYY
jgi:hypothetical protein